MRFIAARIPRAGRIVALVTVALAAACHRNTPATDLGEDSANEPTVIEFRNESLAQADVFVTNPGSDLRRIGTVFAGRTESLTIPREFAMRGSITIVARLLARSRTPSTGSIAISPGTHLSVRLPMDERAMYVLPAN